MHKKWRRRRFKKSYLKMKTKIKPNKLLKLFLILILSANIFVYYYINSFKKEQKLKIFIITHKDFNNNRHNPIYTIVADDKSQLKKNYSLHILYAEKSKLYKKKRAYGEMAKVYYIYELYKKGKISSKYIGINHYRRYFNFRDNIPDMDAIFQDHDVILNNFIKNNLGIRAQFCKSHICETYDEIINIIKEIKPEYYETALRVNNINDIYFCNIFIMKKKDFLKYCEFMFDILFEFDKRHNFKTDDEVLNYAMKFYKMKNDYIPQSRLEGFLSERITNIFIYHNFKKIKNIIFGNY